MRDIHLEGTIILERLAAYDKVDEFYQAVDDDDFQKLRQLMELVNIEDEMIQEVLDCISD